jgi:predicted dehydrogenase
MGIPTRRRDFLQVAAALPAAGVLTATQRAVTASGEPKQADRLVIGLIGCGGRGLQVAGKFQRLPGVELRYVCDVDRARLESAAKSLEVSGSGAASGDMRRLLDDPALDAVIVATPDHWHAPASILACRAGKHVYVEKPISHNIREGRLLVDAAAEHGALVQHGTQCRSTGMMREAIGLLRQGVIGQVLSAKCWNVQKRSSIGRGQDTSPPPELDYDNWLGPVEYLPYRTNRVHNRWTWWHHFGAGDMGNDGVHDLDYTRWGLGVDKHPSKISAVGGKYFFDDDQEFPDTQQVTFEYTLGDGGGDRRMLIYEQRLWTTNYPHNCDSGAEFYGTEGMMFLSRRGKILVRGERNRQIPVTIEPEPQNDVAHIQNFCDAIRHGDALRADALTGHLSTSLCHLGNLATRLGRQLIFDPDREVVIGDDEAQRLVGRPYRDHWGTPAAS